MAAEGKQLCSSGQILFLLFELFFADISPGVPVAEDFHGRILRLRTVAPSRRRHQPPDEINDGYNDQHPEDHHQDRAHPADHPPMHGPGPPIPPPIVSPLGQRPARQGQEEEKTTQGKGPSDR
jgi:hypothetical protein